MKKLLDNIVKTKLGRILDHLFVGFEFFLPKFVLYLIVPTLIFSFMAFLRVKWVTDTLMLKMTLSVLPIFILGAFWFIYRTTRSK
jgi:hypothetical protein